MRGSIFPDKGQRHRVSLQAAAPGSDLQYQKLSYEGATYHEVTDNVTFVAKGRVGVANASGKTTEVPFFDRYYAGGIGSVRGYDQSSLAPRSSTHSDQILGGDTMVSATAELQFPAPFADDVKGLKMSTFVDAGNAYNRSDSTSGTNDKAIRYSAGVGAVWLSPIGPLEISVAKPLNAKDGDEEQKVQFSIGASF